MIDSIFPLPLTIFELYMYLDSQSGYAMDIFRRLNFIGTLNRTSFEIAIQKAVERHPLLRCKVESDTKGRLIWVPIDSPTEISWYNASDTGRRTQSGFPTTSPIDLNHQAGFRVFCFENTISNRTEVIFQYHHSASDGMGEMLFLSDVLTLYAIEIGTIPAETPLIPLYPELLRQRGHLGWNLWRYLWFGLSTTYTTWQMLFSQTGALTNKKLDISSVKKFDNNLLEYPQIICSQLSVEQTQQYIQQAQKYGITVNDLLLGDLTLAIDRWRKENSISVPNGQFRLSVPMNLRNARHKGMPAGNVVTMVFVDVDKKKLNNRLDTIMSIHRKMDWIKTHDQKYVLNLFLMTGQFVGKILGKDLYLFLKSTESRATTCLTNLGRVLEGVPIPRNENNKLVFGNCILDSVDITPPIRLGTALSLSAQTYASSLRLSLRYDSQFLTLQDAQSILNHITDNINKCL